MGGSRASRMPGRVDEETWRLLGSRAGHAARVKRYDVLHASEEQGGSKNENDLGGDGTGDRPPSLRSESRRRDDDATHDQEEGQLEALHPAACDAEDGLMEQAREREDREDSRTGTMESAHREEHIFPEELQHVPVVSPPKVGGSH